ncbi:MAG: ABC-type transport auxiliary lipoprotein family protein [Rhodospirillaceae bacterium]
MTNPASTNPSPDFTSRSRGRGAGAVALLAAVFGLTLAGCLGGSAVPERLFRLSDPQPPAGSGKAVDGMLMVEGFESRGALARERTILYRDLAQANETQFYPASQWEEAPATMVQAAIATCLDRAGLFDGVVRRDRRFHPRYILSGSLDQLEHRVAGHCSDALIRLQVALIDDDTHRVLLRGVYQAAEPAAQGQIEQVLPAFDRGLGRICAALVDDLRHRAPGSGPARPRNDPMPACAGP